MENGAILDSQISASSEQTNDHAAIQGRLHFQTIPGKAGAWSALTNDIDQWLQVDLERKYKVARVATQGRNASNEWVTEYKLQYSNGNDDEESFNYYTERGTDQVKRLF